MNIHMSRLFVVSALWCFLPLLCFLWTTPAQGYIDRNLDLHEHLVRNSAATFFVRAAGDSMKLAGIHDGDLPVSLITKGASGHE